MDAWLSYLRRGVFPGGCFMTTVAIEFDDRPGPVRAALAEAVGAWMEAMARAVAQASAEGHLQTEVDAQQVTFDHSRPKDEPAEPCFQRR